MEEVTTAGDSDASQFVHTLVADGTDIIVGSQLFFASRWQAVDVLDSLPSAQERNPPGLQTLPHVEIAMNYEDGTVRPRPLSNEGFMEPGADNEQGDHELQATNNCSRVVYYIVQRLPCILS